MNSPSTAVEFLDTLIESNLICPRHIPKIREQIPAEDSPGFDPKIFARALIQSGVLTSFQAKRLLSGRTEGFFIGKYRLLDLLGEGGMGKVFLAEQITMKRAVALKLIHLSPHQDESSSTLARFTREARAVAKLRHPNITQAYDFDQVEGTQYIAMELIQGISLQDFVQKSGPLPWAQAADYAFQTACGLEHAQENGLIHRDIKPGNLMVELNGTLKILDLGLVGFHTENRKDSLTMSGKEVILGTADYVSPEQALDSHGVDIRADIYSLGCVLYFLLSGTPPFAGKTAAQKLMAHQTKKPKPIQQLATDVPDELANIVAKMLEKDVEARYQSPQDVQEALRPFIQRVNPAFDPALLNYDRDEIEKLVKFGNDSVGSSSRLSKSLHGVTLPRKSFSGETEDTPKPTAAETKRAPAADRRVKSKPAAPQQQEAPPEAITDDPSPKGRSRRSDGFDDPDIRKKRRRRRKKQKVNQNLKMFVAGLCCFILVGVTITATMTMTGSSGSRVEAAGGNNNNNTSSGGGGIHVAGHQNVNAIGKSFARAGKGKTVTVAHKKGGWRSDPMVVDGKQLPNEGHFTLRGNAANVTLVQKTDSPLLKIKNVKHFSLKNLTLDGNGKRGPIIEIEGRVPGVLLENVTIRNVNGDAIRFLGAHADPRNKCRLNNVKVERGNKGSNGLPITFLSGHMSQVARHIEITNCRLDHNNQAGILVGQPVDGVYVRKCTIQGGSYGIRFAPMPRSWQFYNNDPITDWQLSAWWPTHAVPKFDPKTRPSAANNKTFKWKKFTAKWGTVNLEEPFGRKEDAAALGYSSFLSNKSGKRRLYIGADDELTIWVNGKQVFDYKGHQPHHARDFTCEAHFRKGENHIWVKLVNGVQHSGFSVHISDEEHPITKPEWKNVVIENNVIQNGSKSITFMDSPTPLSKITIKNNRFQGMGHFPILVRRSATPIPGNVLSTSNNQDVSPGGLRKQIDDTRGFHLIPIK